MKALFKNEILTVFVDKRGSMTVKVEAGRGVVIRNGSYSVPRNRVKRGDKVLHIGASRFLLIARELKGFDVHRY